MRKEGTGKPASHTRSPSVVEDELVVGAEGVHVRRGPARRRVVRAGRAEEAVEVDSASGGGSHSGHTAAVVFTYNFPTITFPATFCLN